MVPVVSRTQPRGRQPVGSLDGRRAGQSEGEQGNGEHRGAHGRQNILSGSGDPRKSRTGRTVPAAYWPIRRAAPMGRSGHASVPALSGLGGRSGVPCAKRVEDAVRGPDRPGADLCRPACRTRREADAVPAPGFTPSPREGVARRPGTPRMRRARQAARDGGGRRREGWRTWAAGPDKRVSRSPADLDQSRAPRAVHRPSSARVTAAPQASGCARAHVAAAEPGLPASPWLLSPPQQPDPAAQ